MPSHASSTPLGSRSTSTSCGQVASASPRRIPGRTPAASAVAVTGPSSGSVPGSGASAAGFRPRRGRSVSAARRSKPWMRMQAIMGTYVLHEHTFPCQPWNYPFDEEAVRIYARSRVRWQKPDWLDPRDPLVVIAFVLLALLLIACVLV